MALAWGKEAHRRGCFQCAVRCQDLHAVCKALLLQVHAPQLHQPQGTHKTPESIQPCRLGAMDAGLRCGTRFSTCRRYPEGGGEREAWGARLQVLTYVYPVTIRSGLAGVHWGMAMSSSREWMESYVP